MQRMRTISAVLAILAAILAAPAFAQAPPSFAPGQLDQLVARIALYPDPLLAQVLAAATYPNDIPAAAQWADQHHYLNGQALANAIAADQLPWDPSLQALLPFPSVLDMMNADMNWTTQLGNAFLAQQQDVMDAVQRQRAIAQRYGYLRSNGQVIVSGGPYITVVPVNWGYIAVPWYDPAVVFFAPRPGFMVGGAIRFGFGVTIGGFFAPWGWAPGGNSLRLGRARRVPEQRALGQDLGQPGHLRSSLRRRPAAGPGRRAAGRGACASATLGGGASGAAARQGHASRNAPGSETLIPYFRATSWGVGSCEASHPPPSASISSTLAAILLVCTSMAARRSCNSIVCTVITCR